MEKKVKMKAIVWTKYGPPEVLQLKEVAKPIPKDNEVLIRVYAASVFAGDCELRDLKLPLWLRLPFRIYAGIRKPKRITILGQDLSGEIEAVGKNVTLFKKGDQVFGSTGFSFGAYAEYNCLPAETEGGVLEIKPSNMTYEEAAAVPTGGINALHFLRKGNIQSGQKILINGAGGGIGTFAVQIAKSLGAEVTAVDSTKKLDMLSSIGADHVIDYTQEDFTKRGEIYDVIFDVVGKSSYSGSMKSLKKKGIYLLGNPTILRSIRGRLTSIFSSKKVIGGTASYSTENINILKELIESSKIKSVIDSQYKLEQTAEAHSYVETGNKKGNVVLIVEHNNKN